MSGTDLRIRNMTRTEVDELVEWAAVEGWNPGLHDADIFWRTDPEAFLAAELNNQLIGGGAITCYGEYGFMGFFIIKPAFRGQGLGNVLWHARRDRLLARLPATGTIGMDGVFNMQPYYASGGFVFAHRDLRFRLDHAWSLSVSHDKTHNLVPISAIPFEQLAEYDRSCFPAGRDRFLTAWIHQPDALALACKNGDELSGYGVVRKCREGYKIGPLFADDANIAEALFLHLIEFAEGPVFLDIPENNQAAMVLARRYPMQEVFGCARMYLGAAPSLMHDRIFGVTTFELG